MRPPFGAAVLAALVVAASLAPAAPFRPVDDGEVLEVLPSSGDPGLRQAMQRARQHAADPGDLTLALEVARTFVAAGRREADPRHFGAAAGALAAWWDLPDPPLEVLEVRSAVALGRHDYETARVDLDRILAARPGEPQALLQRASLHEALGDPFAAERDCTRLGRVLPGLAAATCLASAQSLSGMAALAYAGLERSLAHSVEAEPAVRTWTLTTLGEIAARLDDTEVAERHLRAALATEPRDVYARTALCDLYLDTGRPAAVLALTEGETRRDGLLLRRAMAWAAMGSADLAPLAAVLADRFAVLRARGDDGHLRDEARYLLVVAGRPYLALALATRNWQRQRSPADARMLLEAALATGKHEVAAPVLAWMDQTGIEDARLARLRLHLEAGL